MYAVLKQDIIKADDTSAICERGRIYRLSDVVAALALHDVTDAGVDLIVCKNMEEACVSYRFLHMETNPEWEGDDDYAWKPTISRAKFVGEAAARDAALSEA